MKIKSVEMAAVIAKPGGDAPRGLPQVAFAGRSNVGKSSLINRLLGRTRTPVARVSSTPGKTQQINFYRVLAGRAGGREREFFLVDLPGYGFARVPVAVRGTWQPLIERYLTSTPELRGVVQLVDMRHEPTALDRQMLEYLSTLGLPVVVALTKADKLGAAERARHTADAMKLLALPAEQIVPFSASTGAGRDALLAAVERLLERK